MRRTLKLWLLSAVIFSLPASVWAQSLSINTTSPLPSGTVNSAYSVTLVSNNLGTAPFLWSTGNSLPPGLTLSSAGVISGTPTTAGTTSGITITVKDSAATPHTASRTFAVTIAAEPTSITVSSPQNPATFGAAVTFTATITAGATGKISFYDGSTFLGTSTISGTTASVIASVLSAGVNKIKAVYKGSANALASTGTLNQTVNSKTQVGFGAVTLLSNGSTAPFELVSGDFNNDGKVDVAVVNFTSNNVTIMLGNGTGGLTTGNSYSTGSVAGPCA